jgi:septum formation protein
MNYPAIYLASKSPRRQALLQQIAVPFTVIAIDIDEAVQADESAEAYVLRLAQEKAQAGLARIRHDQSTARPVLAADTTVTIDQQILGKPANEAQAYAMLHLLSGRAHQVMTAIALIIEQQCLTALSHSTVTFAPLSPEQIHAYIQSNEPMDKAGAYGIQGLGGQFIRHLEGSYSGVMGLPLYETAQLLRQYTV